MMSAHQSEGEAVTVKIKRNCAHQSEEEPVTLGMTTKDKFYNCITEIVNNKLKFDGARVNLNDVNILEPVTPSKIINFGWTYAGHVTETG
jgi:2-keto-4-pentenoate hydratase/2-oxohepta-3-ene-1,7-dioic acid hydratase in catechol pathway